MCVCLSCIINLLVSLFGQSLYLWSDHCPYSVYLVVRFIIFFFFFKETKSLTDVHQSMALHIFWMLNSLTVHVMWSIPSNIFRGNVTRKPACHFQLFPKDFCLVSLGMHFYFLTLNSALHIPSPFVHQMYHRHVSFKASAMLTVLRTKSRTLCIICVTGCACTLLVQCSVTVTCR